MGNGDAATGHETGHGQRGQGARLIWVRRGSSWGGCTRAVSLTSNLQLVKSENPRVLLTWEYLVLEPGSDVCRLGPSSADYAARHVWPSQETTRSVAVGNSGERPPPTEGSVDEPMDSLSVCRCSLRSPGAGPGTRGNVLRRRPALWAVALHLQPCTFAASVLASAVSSAPGSEGWPGVALSPLSYWTASPGLCVLRRTE
jgi:hypothetical protein